MFVIEDEVHAEALESRFRTRQLAIAELERLATIPWNEAPNVFKGEIIMGQFSIACYRPKPGKEDELLKLTHEHIPILRKEGLVTDRPAYAMRAKDSTIVEVFEWKSNEAINSAHTNPEVIKLWERYGAACDYVPLSTLSEAQDMFAGFEPIF